MEPNNSTASNTTVTGGSINDDPPIDKIYIISAVAGGVLLLVLVIVITVVCRHHRRRKRNILSPKARLPDPEDMGPYSRPGLPNPSYGLNEGDSADGSSTPEGSGPRSPNYQNVNVLFPGPVVDTFDGQNSDEEKTHDYENNPDAIQKYIEDSKRAKYAPKPRINNNNVNNGGMSRTLTPGQTLQPGFGSREIPMHGNSPRALPQIPSQARTLGPGSSLHSLGPSIPKSPGAQARRAQGQMTVNASKSLEDLESRVVPMPPSLPPSSESSWSKRNAANGPAPPPKPHKGKGSGYVNQPA